MSSHYYQGYVVWYDHRYEAHTAGYNAVARDGETEEAIDAALRQVIEERKKDGDRIVEAWREKRCASCNGAGVVYVTIRGRKPDRYGRGQGNEYPCPFCHGEHSIRNRIYLVGPAKSEEQARLYHLTTGDTYLARAKGVVTRS
jgi:DnaJ-class molecular chaperone